MNYRYIAPRAPPNNWTCSSWPRSSPTRPPNAASSPSPTPKGCAQGFWTAVRRWPQSWGSRPPLRRSVSGSSTSVSESAGVLYFRRLTQAEMQDVLSVWSAKDSFAPPNSSVIPIAIGKIVLVIGASIRPIGELTSICRMTTLIKSRTSWPKRWLISSQDFNLIIINVNW